MDQITLKNFRCFREEQTARLAPLTLLVGENSSGKTSFMAMIRALWDVAYQHRVPDFKEDPYDLGSFDEIAHHRGGRGSRAETFEAGFDFTRENEEGAMDGPYRIEVTFGKKGTVPFPVRRCLSSKNAWIECNLKKDQTTLKKDQTTWWLSLGTPKDVWKWKMSDTFNALFDVDRDQLFNFSSLLPSLQATESREKGRGLATLQDSKPPSPSNEDWKLIKCVAEIEPTGFRYSEKPLYASAPVRSKPHRTYDPSRPSRDPEGDYIPMYLAKEYYGNKRRWNALKDALEKFGKDAGLFDEISVRQLGKNESEPFQIQVRKFGNKTKGPQRNLIDVGYGVSQALPVITELLRLDTAPMFLLQQPEVHLHPSAQAALGSLFCQIAGPNRQLVVETHSDHLLDRVRMEVRDGRVPFKPDDVSILFFERDDLDVRIHSLRFDKEGNVLDAPPSYRRFFMEETRRSLGL